MAYKRIAGTASRERRLRREREFRELMEWTRNRPGEYTGRTRSRDDEVRRRWCAFFGVSFRRSRPRSKWRQEQPVIEEEESSEESDDSSSDDEASTTGSSDNAIAEPDTWATDKGPGRLMIPDDGNYIVTAEEFAMAFHLDGRPDNESAFWAKQTNGYKQLWQSVGLMLEQDEFVEVSNGLNSCKEHFQVL